MIHYNKLYQSLKKVSGEWHAGHLQWAFSWNYFRFFEDNTFIYASIQSDNFDTIEKKFNRDSNNAIKGTFLITDSVIKIFFDNQEIKGCVIENNSIILEGKLAWDIYQPIN